MSDSSNAQDQWSGYILSLPYWTKRSWEVKWQNSCCLSFAGCAKRERGELIPILAT